MANELNWFLKQLPGIFYAEIVYAEHFVTTELLHRDFPVLVVTE